MIDWLVGLPILAGMLLSVLVATGSGFAVYLATWSMLRAGLTDDVKGMASNLFRISGTLLGLLLSLTFADVRSDLGKLRDTVEHESAQLSDIYVDLGRFDSESARSVRSRILDYTESVATDEWPALADGEASDHTAGLFHEIEGGLLELDPTTPAQETLRARLLQDMDEITDHRAARYFHARAEPPGFIYVALLGFLCTMAMLGVHAPTSRSLILMSFYCAFAGVVVYFILSLGHPFEGIARVTPAAFEELRESALRAR